MAVMVEIIKLEIRRTVCRGKAQDFFRVKIAASLIGKEKNPFLALSKQYPKIRRTIVVIVVNVSFNGSGCGSQYMAGKFTISQVLHPRKRADQIAKLANDIVLFAVIV